MTSTTKIVAFKYGLFLSLFMLITGLSFRLFNISHNSAIGYVFYSASPVAALLGSIKLKKIQGSISFKTAFLLGLIISLFGNLIYAVFVYVYNRFIDDSLLLSARQENIEQITNSGFSEVQIEQSMKLMDVLTQPGPFAITIFIQLLVFSTILILIIAWVVKTKGRQKS